MGYEEGPANEKFSQKFVHFIEEIWPSVYRAVNGLVFGFFQFIKFILSGLWPGK